MCIRDSAIPVSENHTYLTRAMGLDVNLDVDYHKLDLEPGDRFLLSTDGVHDFVSSAELMEVIAAGKNDFEQACRQMIRLALERGSDDNLSCQLIQVDGLPLPQINDVVSRLTALPFPPFLSEGMTLDGYKIVRELHASNRSQLYLVEDVDSQQRYCMKTPSVNFEDDPAYIERFVMESWIGSRIDNIHVVKVIESGRKKSCLYYLTEYIDGLTLSQWIKENPRPPVQEVVYLVEQIAKGMRAFHRRETMHQDIKPDNVVIDRNGVAKIVDFGSCYVAGIAEIPTPLERDVVLGTANYSAPEHLSLIHI